MDEDQGDSGVKITPCGPYRVAVKARCTFIAHPGWRWREDAATGMMIHEPDPHADIQVMWVDDGTNKDTR